MDNDTKLSSEQIKNLISAFQKTDVTSQSDFDDFTKKYLNTAQSEKLRKLMSDPQLIKSVLSSPQAKKLFEQLKGEGKKDEP